MTTIADNINRLMNEEGITASELSRITGIDRSVLHKIISGSTKNPTIDSIKAIIKHYSFDEVVFGVKEGTHKSCDEIPILSWADAACLSRLGFTSNYKYLKVGYQPPQASFALLIEYTLDNRFPEGTFLIIDQNKKPKNGSYVIVKQENSNLASLKRFILDGSTAYLKSIDHSIPSVQYDDKTTKIVGVVIQSILNFE
ncbi:LexA family protein [Legionella dresdenensis]|uniref:LexA family protein n=1 Tax=Legionella dresdenensis TaxID=450200 RepID=A0ABV8CEH3_9GAMM